MYPNFWPEKCRIIHRRGRIIVNHTLATLRKAEFGFLGVIVEKLTDKSPLLPLDRTVHEIFTSYGSSFNSFEVIGSFSSFENLLPSSIPSRRVTGTNSVTFSFIWNLGSSTSFLFTYFSLSFFFSFFIPFDHSLSPIGLIL